MYQSTRVERLRESMARQNLDAFLISQPESRRHLSSFTGNDFPPVDSDGYILIADDRAFLLTDRRSIEQAWESCPDYKVVCIEEELPTTLARVLATPRATRIGY